MLHHTTSGGLRMLATDLREADVRRAADARRANGAGHVGADTAGATRRSGPPAAAAGALAWLRAVGRLAVRILAV